MDIEGPGCCQDCNSSVTSHLGVNNGFFAVLMSATTYGFDPKALGQPSQQADVHGEPDPTFLDVHLSRGPYDRVAIFLWNLQHLPNLTLHPLQNRLHTLFFIQLHIGKH